MTFAEPLKYIPFTLIKKCQLFYLLKNGTLELSSILTQGLFEWPFILYILHKFCRPNLVVQSVWPQNLLSTIIAIQSFVLFPYTILWTNVRSICGVSEVYKLQNYAYLTSFHWNFVYMTGLQWQVAKQTLLLYVAIISVSRLCSIMFDFHSMTNVLWSLEFQRALQFFALQPNSSQ